VVAPHGPDCCCVCAEALSVLDVTVCIGEHEAHDECAHDGKLVAHCCICGTLGVRESITGWGLMGKDDTCPECAAEYAAEAAEVKRG
jgi:hypothetical protein